MKLFFLSALWSLRFLSAAAEDPTILSPVQDTYVRGGNYADTNYATVTRGSGSVVDNPDMSVKDSGSNAGNTREGLTQFDLAGLSNVYSAELWLHVRGNNRADPLLHISMIADTTWDEDLVTYNTKPVYGALIASPTVPAKGEWMTVDLTSAVDQAVQAGTSRWSLALTGGTVGASLGFATRDDTQGRAPYLVVFTSTGAPTNSPTSFPTPPPTSNPTKSPTSSPTKSPTTSPTKSPTESPTKSPTSFPSPFPTTTPTPPPTLPPSTGAPVVTGSPVTVETEPLDDTFVRDSSANNVYGAYTSLTASYGTSHDNREAYVKLDIQLAKGSPLVSEAKLELWVKDLDPSGMNVNVYPVLTESWDETAVTWNEQPGYDTANPIHTDLTVPAENSWMSIDLTSYVQGKAALYQDTVSIAIIAVQNGGSAGLKTKFSSKEDSAAQIPKFTNTFLPDTGTLPPTATPTSTPSVNPTDGPLSYPQLVSINPSGDLVYEPYANEINEVYSSVANPAVVNTVPDFSNCGYKGGGVPIPFIEVKETVPYGLYGGDARTAIQTAIDNVSALSPDANGFRGAVLIAAGDYQISEPGLSVTTSGVVIRGEGSATTGGTKITFTSTNRDSNMATFGMTLGDPSASGSAVSITSTYVPVGSKSFTVSDASAFSVGDKVIIQFQPNLLWFDQLSNMTQFLWTPSSYELIWRREIIGKNDLLNELTVDGPIVQAIEQVYGGAIVWKYTFSEEITNVGIENIRLESIFASDTDENHGKSAVRFQRVRDGWMRQVTAKYFWYGAVSINTRSSYITVEDSAMLEHKGQISGGRRYSFNIDDSDFLFMQRCIAKDGRHDFVSGSRTPGPNVFVDSIAIDSNSDSGPHHRYATGQLYDNIKVEEASGAGELRVRNRGGSGSGHGWAGAQVMFWNTVSSIICDAPNGGMNWAIGNVGALDTYDPYPEPDGIIQSQGTHVTPRSLYYAQLKQRMGANALHSVLIPDQKTGPVWDALETWAGEGLFGDAVVAWYDEESGALHTSGALDIGGYVRDLTLLGSSPITYTWSKSSGPGTVTFGDATALVTAASFDTAGTYTLQLQVSDGVSTESGSFDITVLL